MTMNIQEAIIVTNNICNLKCIYCKVDELSRKTLSTKDIKNLINELKLRNIMSVHYIGGEPLLRKDITEIMEYSKLQNIKNTLHSNGSSSKLLNKSLKYIDVYQTCLNGNKKTHELLRGENTFNNVIECINLAKKNNIEVIIDMIITSQNCEYQDIDFVMNFAKEKNIKINLQKVFVHNLVGVNLNDIKLLKVSNENAFKLFKYIEENYDENIFLNSKEFIKIHQEKNYINVNQCKNDIAVIGYDGNVASCYEFLNEKNNGVEIGWGNALDLIERKNIKCVTCPYSNHAESNLKNKKD